ncbi:MAG: LamG domain-containing protein, partial [Bacteroidota bacterium]|nr:LamG domain-containing protein [Bacteroidota bacterium]
ATLTQDAMAVSMAFDNCSSGNGYAMGMGVPFSSGDQFEGLFSGVAFVPTGTSYPSPNQWYHIVMLRDGGITKFYFNGVQTPNTYTTTPSTPTGFRIGGQNGCRFWNG